MYKQDIYLGQIRSFVAMSWPRNCRFNPLDEETIFCSSFFWNKWWTEN